MSNYHEHQSIADIPYDENMYVNDLRKRNTKQLEYIEQDSIRLV